MALQAVLSPLEPNSSPNLNTSSPNLMLATAQSIMSLFVLRTRCFPLLSRPLSFTQNHPSSCISISLTNIKTPSSPSRWCQSLAATPKSFLHYEKKTIDNQLKKLATKKIREINTEMKKLEKEEGKKGGFPFEVFEGKTDEQFILKREFDGESVQVAVDMDDGSYSLDHDDNVNLVVTIVKGEGPRLEICCSLCGDEDHIIINGVHLKGPTGDSSYKLYLDEILIKAFQQYLEERGIKKSMEMFMQNCVTKRENTKDSTWLRKLREFVEK